MRRRGPHVGLGQTETSEPASDMSPLLLQLQKSGTTCGTAIRRTANGANRPGCVGKEG